MGFIHRHGTDSRPRIVTWLFHYIFIKYTRFKKNVLPLLPSGEIVLNLLRRETEILFTNTKHCRDATRLEKKLAFFSPFPAGILTCVQS